MTKPRKAIGAQSEARATVAFLELVDSSSLVVVVLAHQSTQASFSVSAIGLGDGLVLIPF
jgi:hypothetical protein